MLVFRELYNVYYYYLLIEHFGSQGYPSPGRTPMVPATMHPQMYQPYQNPHGKLRINFNMV